MRPSQLIQSSLLVLVWALVFSTPGIAATSSDIDTQVRIVGEEIRTDVSFFVRAPRQQVWDVITDFDHATKVFPDMQVSKVLSRAGDTLRVQQKDQVRFGPFTLAVEMVKQVRLVEPVRTESHLVSGSMKRYDAVTELRSERDGTRVTYKSLSIPPAYAMAFIGEDGLKRETEERFRQLRAAILRKQQVAATN